MMNLFGLHSRQWSALFLILLIGGGEARRIDTEFKTRAGMNRNIKQHGARQPQGPDTHTIIHDMDGVIQPHTIIPDTPRVIQQDSKAEVARGWLQYNDHAPMCSVLRLDPVEPGSGRLELHREEDLTAGCEGLLPSKPHRSLLFRADDAVMLKRQQDGDALSVTGEKFYWDSSEDGNSKRKTMIILPVKERLSFRLAFGGLSVGTEWLSFASSREAGSAWLNAFRLVQVQDVDCLSQGTCLAQCTYMESQRTCSSDFCTLEYKADANDFMDYWWNQRPRCTPKVGAAESLEGWEAHKKRVRESAETVRTYGCVLTCQDDWKEVSKGLHFANELSREFTALLDSDVSRIQDDMKTLLWKIKEEAHELSAEAAAKLSSGFDWAKSFSLVSQALSHKGCADLPDGSMEALFRLDASPADQLQEARSAFKPYQDACPWFNALATSPDAGIKDAEEGERSLRQLANTTFGSVLLQQASSSNSTTVSTLDGYSSGQVIPILAMEIVAVAAIVASCVTIAAGISMLIGGALCSSRRVESNASSIAHDHCNQHLQISSSCWQRLMLPGIIVITSGFIVLTMTGVAIHLVTVSATIELAAAGTAATTAIATIQGYARKIKSELSEFQPSGDETSAEEKYVQCMKKFDALAGPTESHSALSGPTQDPIEGLEQLLQDARIISGDSADNERLQQIQSELSALRVVSVDELTIDDWEALESWSVLNGFEQRRLKEALQADTGATGHSDSDAGNSDSNAGGEVSEASTTGFDLGNVEGLAELFGRARIRAEMLKKFQSECSGFGIVNVGEVQKEDWETFSAWEELNQFEKRRLTKALI